MTVIIAGAGIGGLTAALALHSAGIASTVLESVRDLRPLGVGINVQPHAVRELIDLGLGEDLARIGVATAENVYCDRTGAILHTEPRGLAAGYAWPQYSLHRGKLQLLLLDAVRDRLGPDAVRTGTPLLGFDQDPGRVVVRVPGGELTGDALIGADGLHSAVRRALHPGPDPLLWSGVRMWRGVTETGPFLTGRSMVIARGAPGTELIAYPIGPTTVNWVAQVQTAPGGPLPGDANGNQPGDVDEVLAHFGDWDLGWLDVPALIGHHTRLLEYPMVDRDPLPDWGTGRVTLLGDAAHPMYPVGANGASQAVIDARVLADELFRDLPGGLARYEQARRTATAAIVDAGRGMQRTWHIRSGPELARITDDYRRTTTADAPRRD
ncbi:FAD-dependent monooxygenase [Streptomyces sp. NPDC050560]|uniref:FAD-dependent monooxygenase n=1 Tax=Streptomyces sp. NPDC050560 TaxID=3365630 RepID=UPI0037A32414